MQRRKFFSQMSLLALSASQANAFGFYSLEDKFKNFFSSPVTKKVEEEKVELAPVKIVEKKPKIITKVEQKVKKKEKIILNDESLNF